MAKRVERCTGHASRSKCLLLFSLSAISLCPKWFVCCWRRDDKTVCCFQNYPIQVRRVIRASPSPPSPLPNNRVGLKIVCARSFVLRPFPTFAFSKSDIPFPCDTLCDGVDFMSFHSVDDDDVVVVVVGGSEGQLLKRMYI